MATRHSSHRVCTLRLLLCLAASARVRQPGACTIARALSVVEDQLHSADEAESG